MKNAIAIAVLAVTAATAVLAQDNPGVGEPTHSTVPREEQIRLGKVERLRAEQEWFRLEQMWVSMREQMREQIRQEMQAGVPPEQIQTEIQEQQQILEEEPVPEYVYVPVSAGPVQTVFITPMDTERERHERERWEREHLEHERRERERMEKYRAEWERIRTQEMQRMREMHPELAARIVAGNAKAQSPTAAPVVQRTATSPTATPRSSPPPPPPKVASHPPPAPPPPPAQHPPPAPPPPTNKGTRS